MATHRPIAMPTPTHIGPRARRSPRWIRNAAMIPTISEASRPSRRPMTKVGIILPSRPFPAIQPNDSEWLLGLPKTAFRLP